MQTFNWSKVIGYGISIWIIMFAVVWFFVGISWYDNTASDIVILLIAALLTYSFSASLRSTSASQGFGVGFVWIVIGIVLDLIISGRFLPGIFKDWYYWVGYAVILLVPALSASTREGKNVGMSQLR